MKELVRCRPCGYVMEKAKLNGVCPACGLPDKVFEAYREKVSPNRLFILNLDLHPIAIHISQCFIALIPLLLGILWLFPEFHTDQLKIVVEFLITLLPLALALAFITGIIDGITLFKSLKPPLLRDKIIYSILLSVTSVVLLFVAMQSKPLLLQLFVSLVALAFAVVLGLIGKSLLNVILPGKYPQKKAQKK
jgi:amino acid transporter